jgi:serine O-acetyltransferase
LKNLRCARVHCGPIGTWAWAIWKFGNRFASRSRVLLLVYRMLDFVVVRTWTGARIPREVTIGQRVGFVHDAQGLILHPQVVIGDDCTIYHQDTIGHLYGKPGAPRIGNGVLIGAGAKVLGPVHIGDFVAIRANAVVTTDVPDGATVVGNPGVVRPPRDGWERRPRR